MEHVSDLPDPSALPGELAQGPVSAFHHGEQAVQARLGTQARMAEIGPRVIRDYMPDQHRELFEKLPFLVLGTADSTGQPWAGLVTGMPGFVQTEPHRMTINALPAPDDQVSAYLRPGASVGILGLELTTRRRNRMNGIVGRHHAVGFSVEVEQSFGNCPKYIQTRVIRRVEQRNPPAPRIESPRVSADAQALISMADTFFIASRNPPLADRGEGADVSHRGGKPGFVSVSEQDGRTVLTVPDFGGNGFFNTFGNLTLDARCGLLFLDFACGHQLQLAAQAEIVWEGPELDRFAGAARLLRLVIEGGVFRPESLPFRSEPAALSPYLADTGDWRPSGADAKPLIYGFGLLTLAAIERESALVSSFWLAAQDGAPLPQPVAGQFLPIAVEIPNGGIMRRTYTISAYANGRYRLSIKRERLPGRPDGKVSNFVHDHWQVGMHVSAGVPRGDFVLDNASESPILMLAGGIGVTPLLAMLRALAATQPSRQVVLIVAARHALDHPFRAEIAHLREGMPNLTTHVRYSEPDPASENGADSVGLVDADLLKTLLPSVDTDVYLCGPAPFMTSMDQVLAELGVLQARIRTEAFGPATPERKRAAVEPEKPLSPAGEAALVTFAQSGLSAPFDPRALNLLEFAEDLGLSPSFSCRSGSCGSCATRRLSGAVRYVDPPLAVVGSDEVLLCCALPDGAVTLDA